VEENHYVIHTLESLLSSVFSTHDRLSWIDKSWQERLAQYIGGIVRDIEGIAIEIGGDSDHSHILARLRAKHGILDSELSNQVHQNGFMNPLG
jgi:hypothetical protein